MYTTPQMHQENPVEATAAFPSLWDMSLSTLKMWKDGWGIFTLINLCMVLIGSIALLIIDSIMPWIKTFLTHKKALDPVLIASYYPTITTLVHDLIAVGSVIFVFMIFIVLSQIMTIHAMNAETRARGLKHLFLFSIRLIPKYTWTLAMVSLMIAGGVSLLLIPGILVLPIAIVAVFVAALENTSGVKALMQSSQYVKGYLIEALWRSIVILVIVHAISLILPVLATFPVYPFTLLNFSEHTIKILGFIAGTIYTFISLILSMIMPSLLMIFYFLMYSHMKNNPTSAKPISVKILVTLAVIGVLVILGTLILEAIGF